MLAAEYWRTRPDNASSRDVGRRARTSGDIAEQFEMSRPATSRHLRVLPDAIPLQFDARYAPVVTRSTIGHRQTAQRARDVLGREPAVLKARCRGD